MLILLPENSIVQSRVDWFVIVILKVYDESRLTFPLEIEFITIQLHNYKHQCWSEKILICEILLHCQWNLKII